ncbi:hypothetical protein EMIT0196MI5_50121 [Pseudomonas sp. IT-196MI5]
MSSRPSSRASPLPQLIVFIWKDSVPCGSGLAREEARTDNITLAAPPIKHYHGRSFADRVHHEVRHRRVLCRPCALLAPRLAVRPSGAGRRA